MLQHALRLAAAGWHVFPCSPGTKIPLAGTEGVYDATTDLPTIKALWEECPDANVAIAPGASGCVVLDVEGPAKGVDGRALLLNLPDGPLDFDGSFAPGTMAVSTPSGGLHIYYRDPDETIRNTAGRIAKGIDTRARGGYVVAPGSRLPGGAYELLGEIVGPGALPVAPAFFDVCRKSARDNAQDPQEWLVEPDEPGALRRAARFLATTQPAIEGEGGDAWTVKTAAVVRDFGVSPGACLELMLEHWNDRCEPPWEPEELAVKVRNGYAYAERPAGNLGAVSEEFKAAAARAKAESQGQGSSEVVATRRSPFAVLTGDEILAMPDPVWLVDQLIQENTLVLFSGVYGSFKSFVALDFALSLARGSDILGRFVPSRRCKVLYCAGEGAAGLKLRYAAYSAKRGGGSDQFLLARTVPRWADDASLAEFAKALADLKPDFVVIDTLARSSVGLDENSAKDIAVIVEACDAIREAPWRPTVFLVHHEGKDTERGSRGSSALPGAVDTEIRIKKAAGSLRAQLTVSKQKDSEEGTWPLVGEKVDLGSGNSSLVFRVEEPEEKPAADPQEKASKLQWAAEVHEMRAVLKLAGKPMTLESMAEAMLHYSGTQGQASARSNMIKRYRRALGLVKEAGRDRRVPEVLTLWNQQQELFMLPSEPGKVE